jgi:hypothetical protein
MSEPRCTHCGAPITSENTGWLVACEQCQTPHFRNPVGFSHADNAKEKLALLERYTITQTADGVEIKYRNMTTTELITSIIALSLLTVVILTTFHQYAVVLILIVPLFGYGLVFGVVNRTTIFLLANRIETTSGPLPVPRFRTSSLQAVDTSAIEQVRSFERIENDAEGSSQKYFDVSLRLKIGDDMLLIVGLRDPTEAYYFGRGIQQLYHLKVNPQFDSVWYLFSD